MHLKDHQHPKVQVLAIKRIKYLDLIIFNQWYEKIT